MAPLAPFPSERDQRLASPRRARCGSRAGTRSRGAYKTGLLGSREGAAFLLGLSAPARARNMTR